MWFNWCASILNATDFRVDIVLRHFDLQESVYRKYIQIYSVIKKDGHNFVRLYFLNYTRYVMTGEWRKLHNEELDDLYSLPNILWVVKSRRMRWAGHLARMGEDRGVHRVLVGKPEGKRPLGRPRRRWEDNIKMDVQEVGGGRGDWMEFTQNRDSWRALVGTVRNFRVP